ncbi:MAG: glycoside hydrolase family 5 protein, partial [Anaerolineae bacterium]|nr:glycoside hydrolase family 5 protein [Anaerolineae bacterium]
MAENPTHFSRSGAFTLSSGKVRQVVRVSQEGKDFWTAPDRAGVESDAVALAKKIHLGWNLGNSLEACSDENNGSETLWGNPKTSQALIDLIRESGFNAVRIPTAWSGYVEDPVSYKIKDEWIMRVREVVDYCVANGMYAIINIHWDGGWLENHPTYARQVEVNKKQKALWEQIAVAFRDYDEHLLFAGTNEVHADYNRPTAEHLDVQMSYNQTFVDAVRSTGGKNAWRVLVVQGYNTNIQYTYESLVMPQDAVADRMMAEVHYYDPYDFTIDGSSSAKYLWGKEYKGNPGA